MAKNQKTNSSDPADKGPGSRPGSSAFLLLLLLFFIHACTAAPQYRTVTASWYGKWHAGKMTASGELFDPRAFTAAHRTYPFGSLIEVRNPLNDKTVVVRVNDRGPFVLGRSLDLSEAAARELKIDGVQEVEVRVLGEVPRP